MRFVEPSELSMTQLASSIGSAALDEDEGSACVITDSCGPIDHFILEIDQDCLCYEMDQGMLLHILKHRIYMNDIRTILLVHDKRLLAVLTNESIMSDYVCAKDVALLQRYIIPTYVVGNCPDEISNALLKLPFNNSKLDTDVSMENRSGWLLKPRGGGKGAGILFGYECCGGTVHSKEDVDYNRRKWNRVVEDNSTGDLYVVQPYVSQTRFNILTATDQSMSTIAFSEMLVVGLIHNFNSMCLGPGIFRASFSNSNNPIVNISGGNGLIISPCIFSSRTPLVRNTPTGALGALNNSSTVSMRYVIPNQYLSGLHLSSDILSSVQRALERDGIAVITTENNENSATYTDEEEEMLNHDLIAMASQLGVINEHSSAIGAVWDVRPTDILDSHSLPNSNPARSKTSHQFPLHTDCSFENPPPRYMCLYVKAEDMFGGGDTTLIDSRVLLKHFSVESQIALQTYDVAIRIPPEFSKSNNKPCGNILRGKLLSKSGCFRYRSDIVVRPQSDDHSASSVAIRKALEELDKLLHDDSLILTTQLKKGQVLLLDNYKWFHGRTAILDKDRWLKRIRFHRFEFAGDTIWKELSMAQSCGRVHLEISENSGVFKRASCATKVLQLICDNKHGRYEFKQLIPRYSSYLRCHIQHIEALQYYMMDMKSIAGHQAVQFTDYVPTFSPDYMLFRYFPRNGRVLFDLSDVEVDNRYSVELAWLWFMLQLANTIITDSRAIFVLPRVLYYQYQESMNLSSSKLEVVCFGGDGYFDLKFCIAVYTLKKHGSSVIISKCSDCSYVVELDSVSPAIEELLIKQYKSNTYITSNLPKASSAYSNVNDIYFDEFDVLCDEERTKFVSERFEYLMACLKLGCNFYKDLECDGLSSDSTIVEESPGYAAIPFINGDFLRDHGRDKLVGNQKYHVSFASGGTKGAMKHVYRNTWEDSENSRYIAKGLLVSGLRPHDTVLNTLAGGFWGGYHVYNLALQIMGCAVVPLGISTDFPYVAEFISNLKPSTLLGMPNWILSFVEYLESVFEEFAKNGQDYSVDYMHATCCVDCIRKLVIGGEMLFQEGREKINRILVNIDPISGFISTGYTSNETGVIAFRCPYAAEICSLKSKPDCLPADIASSIPNGGYFHVHENMQFVTIKSLVDAPLKSENQSKDGGKNGMLVTTNLNRTLMPMVKYATGDLCRVPCENGALYKCPCGRTLSTLVLYGRCDDRIRVAGEDIYANEIAKVISMVPELSLHFTIKVKKSYRLRDALEIHVECLGSINPSAPGLYDCIEQTFLKYFVQYCNTFKSSCWNEKCGAMEVPLLVLYKANTLPRNERTGKIPSCVDLRK